MIRQAEKQDLPALAELAVQMWTSHSVAELMADFEGKLDSGAAFFLAMDGQNPVGFAQCQIRHDYVEGTESSPVGYLEGVYVAEQHRRRGIARELLDACQNWARAQGCREFASDCELDNRESLRFHLSTGFEEANRIICFTKRL